MNAKTNEPSKQEIEKRFLEFLKDGPEPLEPLCMRAFVSPTLEIQGILEDMAKRGLVETDRGWYKLPPQSLSKVKTIFGR